MPFQEEDIRGRDAMMDGLARYGIADPRVLTAMARVPRHAFVPPELRHRAYDDGPLPIGMGQTISQPYMVARMVEALELTGSERVLDIGTGSGYQAAILGELADEVWSVEIIPELAESARECLARLGYANVHVTAADGSVGLARHAPYDAIVVAAASPEVPVPLLEQLCEGGRLVIPVGDRVSQDLQRIRREPGGAITESLLGCRFVPLLGERGWAPVAEAW